MSYPLEIWPYHLRAHGLGMAWVSAVLAIIFNVFVNPIALATISWKYYTVFVVILVFYGLTIYFLYPETRGHTLKEMAIVFDKEGAGMLGTQAIESVEVGIGDKGTSMSGERSDKQGI